MYNEQIENLINLALVDGQLSEKEKEVLLKKAEEAGIDRAEFEMVLEARLYEKQVAMKSQSLSNVSSTQTTSINTVVNASEDKPGIGWQILAFIIPLAGLIMYFNTKNEFPIKASRYGTLAAIGFLVGLIINLS